MIETHGVKLAAYSGPRKLWTGDSVDRLKNVRGLVAGTGCLFVQHQRAGADLDDGGGRPNSNAANPAHVGNVLAHAWNPELCSEHTASISKG